MKKRGIFSNKKAQGDIESYFVLIKLILAFAAIFAMSAYVYSVATDTFFNKLYFSRDISFMANTVYFAPGNVYQEYNREGLDKFGIGFEDQKVEVIEDEEKKKGLTFNYFFAQDLNYNLKEERIKDSNKIAFQKSPCNLEISSELSQNLKLIECPKINAKEENWVQKKVLINPENKKYDVGSTQYNLIDSLGSSVYEKIPFVNKKTTKDNKEALAGKKRLIDESEIIITLDMGDYESENNDLKIYFSSEGENGIIKKRKDFSSLIWSEILSYKELGDVFTGGNIIGISPKQTKEEYGIVLENEKISIIIEVGNIKSEKINSLNKAEIRSKIADGINKGIENYYG